MMPPMPLQLHSPVGFNDKSLIEQGNSSQDGDLSLSFSQNVAAADGSKDKKWVDADNQVNLEIIFEHKL